MKKLILMFVLLVLAGPDRIAAARAYPNPKTVCQPDGTTITLLGHGDEFRHYVTTTDGYTVLKDTDGIYRYAVEDGVRLKPSRVRASDVHQRTSYDSLFLSSIRPHLKPEVGATGRKLMMLSSRNDGIFSQRAVQENGRRNIAANGNAPYRGLVILVNFTDSKFSRGDRARQMVDDMMNRPDYTYYDDPLLQQRVLCTGSVRDYFADNSGGMFIPEFDVVGPVEVDVDQYFINATENTYELCSKILQIADPDVDYSRYDADGDGVVDMFYVLYAGYASTYQGNDERLVWPHAGHFADFDTDVAYDGMRFGRFACSSEIYGWQDYADVDLDGIGVIVHEFSHVLGFKDHYDVSGYLNEDPGQWDVMASGNYNGVCNDTPCGYNSYEKFAAGFLTPRTVAGDEEVPVSLRPLSASDDAIRIKSTQDSTVFMIENRQLEKWDSELPGHGMLVWRVDSCDNEFWEHNALNVNGRLHFKLIRARGATRTLFQEIQDTDYDPFPGSMNVSELTNYTKESNLLSDLNYPSPLNILNIRETDGIISFDLEHDPEADFRPFTFCLNDRYDAVGVAVDDETSCNWSMRAETVWKNNREVSLVYDLIPDSRGISSEYPQYADGLAAAYTMSADRSNIHIEPYRVALIEDYGVWLVDFNNLDNGGSGSISLDINPYGDLMLSDPECILGYCLLPKNAPLVTSDAIIERFGLMKDIHFDSPSGIELIQSSASISHESDDIFNLQGMKAAHPKKGEVYIIGGKKVIYQGKS